jgi:hypothetical protein
MLPNRVSHIRFFELFASKRIEANPILIRFQFASFSEYSLQNICFDSLWFSSKYSLQNKANVKNLHHKKEQNSKNKTLFYSFCQLYNKKNCQITLYTTFWCYLPFTNIYSLQLYLLQLYSLHIIFACLYSLLLVICFEANQSESDPFIHFKANKYSLRYSLKFISKRISGTP